MERVRRAREEGDWEEGSEEGGRQEGGRRKDRRKGGKTVKSHCSLLC